MKRPIRKYWIESFELMARKPVLVLPFIIIGFFEGIALEIAYFCARPPISLVANPMIRKFFGEEFSHYPANLILLPKLFYYLQTVIYVFLSVFLTAIAVNIFNNIRSGLPVKANALVKNALGRYMSFVMYGAMMIVLLTLMQKAETFVFAKFARLAMKHIVFLPQIFYGILFMLSLFISNIMLQTFFVLTVPVIVLGKKPFFKAVLASVTLGARNFFRVFTLISLPFLAYLPIVVLKNDPARLADKLFPEAIALVTAVGIIVSIFADCFIILCASRFMIDTEKT